MTSADGRLRSLIWHHEGERRFPYVDTVGKVTIGIGRNLTDVGLYPDEISTLFTNDLNRCLDDLSTFEWFRWLDPWRQRALVDFRFQLGPEGFRSFQATLDAIARKDYAVASAHLLQSKYAQQVPARARTIAAMLATGSDVRTA